MSDGKSLAAQAVANGPHTIAPTSFEGHGWLVVVNLTLMTAAAAIGLMVVIYLARLVWRDRRSFPARTPLRLWRTIGLCFATGIMLRCGIEAANIWGWDPLRPAETARFLFAKRLLDPIAVTCGLTGLALLVLSAPGMIEQLGKQPLPIRIWQAKRVLINMGGLGLLSLIAAVGVVSTR